MMQAVYFVCTSVIIITVAPNPVTQVLPALQCPICQQNPYNNPVPAPAPYQLAATQTNPYPQPITVQNQTPNRHGLDGSINQILMSKILENPCLQKILDPNTKLYNQNGQEIQRHANKGTAPSVVNNYFIVPPEFFSLNDTKVESNNTSKRKRGHSVRKLNQTKTKTEIVESESNKLIDEEPRNRKINVGQTRKKTRKHKQDAAPTKIIEEHVGLRNADENDFKSGGKKMKRRRKQIPKNVDKKGNSKTPLHLNNSKEVLNEKESLAVVNNNANKIRKRPNKSRTHSKITEEKISETSIDIEDTKVTRDDVSIKNKIEKNISRTKNYSSSKTKNGKSKDGTEFITSSESIPQLKNIEFPVDNEETIKDITENRQTRNSKNNKAKKEYELTQGIAPISDDVFKKLFSYMYPGNYFSPNAFNFEQFYRPNFVKNSRKNKKRKNKTNLNENNRESLPNVVQVKLKTNKQEKTTIVTPFSEETTEVPVDLTSTEVTTKCSEPVTDIPMEIPHEVFPKEGSYESLKALEPMIPNAEPVTTKVKLKMPPTMIENLEEYLTPAAGRENKLPTLYTNGIISDYYPIFYDDSYYANDESYYFKDLEDDRHFYTTDRGHEDLLNRDRRKYSINDGSRTPNLDRAKFRRGFTYREKGRIKYDDETDENSIQRPYTHTKIKKEENIPAVTETNKEDQFQTPPMLEKPDFRTNQIVTESSMTNSHDLREPMYTSYSAEKVSDIPNTYFDKTLPQFGRVVNIESEIRKEKVLPANTRPKNDRIETVFAKTRVVKYGVAKDESEENVSVSVPVHEDDDEMKHYSDGRTTYVLAKSVGQLDDYYW